MPSPYVMTPRRRPCPQLAILYQSCSVRQHLCQLGGHLSNRKCPISNHKNPNNWNQSYCDILKWNHYGAPQPPYWDYQRAIQRCHYRLVRHGHFKYVDSLPVGYLHPSRSMRLFYHSQHCWYCPTTCRKCSYPRSAE